jgi:hypothetical protein
VGGTDVKPVLMIIRQWPCPTPCGTVTGRWAVGVGRQADLVVGGDQHAGAQLEADVARLGLCLGHPAVRVMVGECHLGPSASCGSTVCGAWLCRCLC